MKKIDTLCRGILVLAVLLFAAGPLGAQERGQAPSRGPEQGEAARPESSLPESWVKSLPWRCIGPANMGGRITALAVFEKDPAIYWVATASGGLLKTTNHGTTFEHQFDHEATVSIGDVAVAPSDVNIVWVGTGEANPRNSVSWGDGVYKSTDGGKTWKNMGLRESFQIGGIAIHPENPDIVYVGALGRLWGPNEERGLFKTTDGGETWAKILYLDDKTGVIDVQMKPDDPDTLLVATYERRRDLYDTNDPAIKWGPGSGLYRTTDGGGTWKRVTDGLPTGMLGRIGIDFYRKEPNVVYVVLETEKISQEPENAPYLGAKGEDAEVGARITEVTEGGPAAQASLQVGDVVIRVEETPVLSWNDFLTEVRKRLAGDTVKLELSRNRKVESLEVTFGKRPENVEDQSVGEAGGEAGGEEASEATPKAEESKKEEAGKEEPPKEIDQREVKAGPFTSGLGGQRENVQEQQGPAGHEYGGVYRSDDGGETWKRINSLNPRPMYFSEIRVDPSDNQYLYVLGISLYRSKDGGATFTSDGARGGVHVDHHALWVDPGDGRHMLLGNDGGLYVTFDRMDHWDHLNHMAIGQFYKVAVDGRRDYRVYGGLQDNGSWGGPSRARDGSGPRNADWVGVGGGDGFGCAVDREDPDLVYTTSQNGGLSRIHLRTGERGFLRARPPRGVRYRFNWNTPFLLSQHNTKIYYCAGNFVMRSLDRGEGLKVISPEISRTDRGTATALAESPLDSDVLYVGTDDGAVWRTRDGGHTWENLFELPKEEEGEKAKTDEAPAAAAPAEPPPRPAEEASPEAAPPAAPAPESAPGESAPSETGPPEAPPDPLVGAWEAKVISEMIPEGEGGFDLTFSRGESGVYQGVFNSEMGDGDLSDIRFYKETGKVFFKADFDAYSLQFQGTLTGSEMKGTMEASGGGFSARFEARRVAAEAAPRAVRGQRRGGERPAGRRGGRPGGGRPSAEGADRGEFEWKPLQELVPEPRGGGSIVASRFEAGRVYLVLDGHRSDDDEPQLLVSEDYGNTWRSIRGNLPTSAGTTRVIAEDLSNPNLLFLGAEFSAWVSIDRGASWTSLTGGLPTVAVHDFALHPTAGEMVAATHGRSLWILDVSALRQITPEIVKADAHLFSPMPAVLWKRDPERGDDGPRSYVGENPPWGAPIYYSLGRKPNNLRLEIVDLSRRADGRGPAPRDLGSSGERAGGRRRRAREPLPAGRTVGAAGDVPRRPHGGRHDLHEPARRGDRSELPRGALASLGGARGVRRGGRGDRGGAGRLDLIARAGLPCASLARVARQGRVSTASRATARRRGACRSKRATNSDSRRPPLARITSTRAREDDEGAPARPREALSGCEPAERTNAEPMRRFLRRDAKAAFPVRAEPPRERTRDREPDVPGREAPQGRVAPSPEIEVDVLRREILKDSPTRAVSRVAAHPRELAAQDPQHVRGLGLEPELVVEPPRPRPEPFLVLVSELVGIDVEGVASEQVADHGQHAGVHARGLRAAPGVEHVVRDSRRPEERAREHVADRHSVLEGEEAVDRLEEEASLGDGPEAEEGETFLEFDDANVVRIRVGEDVEVALPRDHRLAREVDHAVTFAPRQRPHRRGGAPHLAPKVGATGGERGGLEMDRRSRPLRARPRRGVRSRREPHRDVEALEDRLASERIGGQRREPPHEERGVRLLRAFQRPDPVTYVEGELVEPRRLAVRHEEMEESAQLLRVVEFVPLHREAIGPAPREPVRHREEEGKANLGSRDPAVGERLAPAPEIGTPREAGEHRFDPREQAGVVGIGAEEAESFVEPRDLVGRAQRPPPQAVENLELRLRGALAEAGLRILETGEQLGCRSSHAFPPSRMPGTSVRRRRHSPHRATDCKGEGAH